MRHPLIYFAVVVAMPNWDGFVRAQTAQSFVLLGLLCLAAHGEITVQEIGRVEVIKDAEFQLGATDRMFLIEDQWEFSRCSRLLPKLPKIDPQTESLLVVMSWKYTARTLKGVHAEGDTLVIKVDQAKPPGAIADSYHPPKFLVFKIPAWKGPVRFEVNGESSFTVLRGEALTDRSNQLWEEILRVHSGGRPTLPQLIRYYRRMWPNMTEKEIRTVLMENKEKHRNIDPSVLYTMLFRELIDIRAKPSLPRVFNLIESMGKHDKALRPACDSIVGIGGPEAVDECKKALTSWNPRCRGAAMSVLATFALPETRELAREKLADLNGGVSGGALSLLRRIEIKRDDVPAMIHALEQTEKFYLASPDERRKVANFNPETAKGIIYAFGELGPEAEESLPILKRFATDPRLPVPGFQPDAKTAIEKIQAPQPKGQ